MDSLLPLFLCEFGLHCQSNMGSVLPVDHLMHNSHCKSPSLHQASLSVRPSELSGEETPRVPAHGQGLMVEMPRAGGGAGHGAAQSASERLLHASAHFESNPGLEQDAVVPLEGTCSDQ